MKPLEELRAYFAHDRFATELCGIEIVEAEDGGATCRMALADIHRNAWGAAQGGAIYTLCDTTFAVAANAGDARFITSGGQIDYVRPGMGDALVARAERVAQTRRTALYRVTVFNDAGELVAHATFNGFRHDGA